MALSVLQDKGLGAVARHHCRMKEDRNNEDTSPSDNNNKNMGGFPSLLSPSQLFPAGLINPLALQAGLFQSGPLLQWAADRVAIHRPKPTKRKLEKEESPVRLPTPPSPPTSGSSPQSNGSGQEIHASSKGSDKMNGREKVFVCRICNHSFGYKHVLQNHERTHTGEKPFECSQCHKRFTRDHHLKTHMRLHTGEKPYHCPHCDRHFVQVANLRRHLRVHTGERPYACQLCSSRFSDSNQLKAHTLIHKGEKPFECGTCGGRFRRRHHLVHHKCQSKDSSDMDMDMDMEAPFEEVDEPESEGIFAAEPLKFDTKKVRERKSRDIRRVVRVGQTGPILKLPIVLPEQTEPEDLSISKSHKHDNNNTRSPSHTLMPWQKASSPIS